MRETKVTAENRERNESNSGEQSERNESNSGEQRERNESNSGEQSERNESNSGEQRERNESNSGENNERAMEFGQNVPELDKNTQDIYWVEEGMAPDTKDFETEFETEEREGENYFGRTQVVPQTKTNEENKQTTVMEEEQIDQQHGYKTKHAAQIALVVGNTSEVTALDDLRHQLKSSKITSTLKLKHDTLLTKLQAQVQREKSTILSQIKSIEMSYFKERQCLPNTHIQKYLNSKKNINI